MFTSLRLVVLAGLILGPSVGCRVSIDDPGTDPAPGVLNFPAGIAMDPGGRFLYVSNGNADLRFGGGTLMMIDTVRFECALDHLAGLPPDPSCAAFPSADDVAITHDPDDEDRHLSGCVLDPIDPQVIDCVEAPFVLKNSTVRVGNFAGSMRVRRTGPETRSLYLVVRGDPSVTRVEVDLGRLIPPDARGQIDRPGVLGCFDDLAAQLDREGYDAASNTTTVPPRCDKSHLVQTFTCAGRFGCEEGENDIPPEPFNILLDEGKRTFVEDGAVKEAEYARLLVAHLSAGNVSLVNLLGAPLVADVSPPFYVADQAGRRGVFGLARRDDPERPIYYLSSNLTSAISTFYVDDSPAGGTIVPGPVFSIGSAFSSGSDGRELLFEPGGRRAFLSENAPPSIAVIDTRADQPDGRGLPANKVVDVIEICQGPSHMALRQDREAVDAGGTPRLRTRLYVACFTANQVMIVDPDRPGVDETILVGRGPNELTFNWSGDETAADQRMPIPRRRRAYLTDYSESTLSVLDLEPGSPTENRLIARIGLPVPARRP
jgi:DNA-binding beta-propeller fold protein YncE